MDKTKHKTKPKTKSKKRTKRTNRKTSSKIKDVPFAKKIHRGTAEITESIVYNPFRISFNTLE